MADHAKLVMQAAAAGTGVRLSDGSTNILPLGRRPGSVEGGSCTPGSSAGRSSAATTRAGTCIRPSCPRRFAATYAFYRGGLPRGRRAAAQLRATDRVQRVDEPATARALADFIVRGVDCGGGLGRRRSSEGPGWTRPAPRPGPAAAAHVVRSK